MSNENLAKIQSQEPNSEISAGVWPALKCFATASSGFLISQSQTVSEAFAQHQLRMATVAALKQGFIQSAVRLSQTRAGLVDRRIGSDEFERIRIDRDLGYIDGEIRRLSVYTKASEFIGEAASGPEVAQEDSQVEPSWLDRFDDEARRQNEPWRRELLAKALAAESNHPGSVGTRGLWFVGTVEQEIFTAFSTIIDLSAKIGGTTMVPTTGAFEQKPIPNCQLGNNVSIGNLLFRLSELGILGDPMTSASFFDANKLFVAKYGSKQASVTTKLPMNVQGIIPTSLGSSIAALCKPKSNPLGDEIFENWLGSIDSSAADIQKNW